MYRNVCRQNMVGIGQSRLFVHLCKKWVNLCGCVCVYLYVLCVDVFVCMLVGNIATSCVSGDTQDAEVKPLGTWSKYLDS